MDENSSRTGFLDFIFGKYSDYIRRIKPLFGILTIIFLFSMVSGYVLGKHIPETILDDLFGNIPQPGNEDFFGQVIFSIRILLFIFINNVTVGLISILGGIILAIPPLFFSILNGFIVGFVAFTFIQEQGIWFVIVGLLPHGIIEIPAILLSMAMGMGLGYKIINRIRGEEGLVEEIKLILGLFLRRVIPLLMLSAIIEVTITPFLISLVTG
jgi:stage II sporulation protein M